MNDKDLYFSVLKILKDNQGEEIMIDRLERLADRYLTSGAGMRALGNYQPIFALACDDYNRLRYRHAGI